MTPRRPALSFIFVTLALDRKSTRLNSSHTVISYAVFCLKKKKHHTASVTTQSDHDVRRAELKPVYRTFGQSDEPLVRHGRLNYGVCVRTERSQRLPGVSN